MFISKSANSCSFSAGQFANIYQNLKTEKPYDYAQQFCCQEFTYGYSPQDMYKKFHCSIVYNREKIKISKMPIKLWDEEESRRKGRKKKECVP